jgi:hypothetical protein
MPHRLQAARSNLGDWAFWVWAVVGLGFGFAISAIGIFTVPASLLATIVLLTQPRLRQATFGILVGIGAVLLLVAYLNREGPGKVCHTFSNGFECAEGLPDPRRWLAVGLVFIAAGIAGHFFAARMRLRRA